MPQRYRDELPPQPPPIVSAEQVGTSDGANLDDNDIQLSENRPDLPAFTTDLNSYGVYRVYPHGRPSYTPDELHTLQQVSDSSTFVKDPSASESRTWWSPLGSSLVELRENYFAPFLNASIFRLMSWFYGGSNLKSLGELDRLVNEVILANDFQQKDFVGFSASRESERLDKHEDGPGSRLPTQDGWIETSVKISLPADGVKHRSEADAPQFSVPGLFYRRPLEVLKSAFQEDAAENFHVSAHEMFWKPSPESPPERIYSELYTADAFIAEQEKIKQQPREPGCELETVVASIMLWSDSTHLTSFGNASLWPIYMFFGNLSKYIRAKPTSFAAHHLAYIPKVCLLDLPQFHY